MIKHLLFENGGNKSESTCFIIEKDALKKRISTVKVRVINTFLIKLNPFKYLNETAFLKFYFINVNRTKYCYCTAQKICNVKIVMNRVEMYSFMLNNCCFQLILHSHFPTKWKKV